MDVELKTGGMARMPAGHDAKTSKDTRTNKGRTKDRHFFVDQRLFWGMMWLVGTIDASAFREMNL